MSRTTRSITRAESHQTEGVFLSRPTSLPREAAAALPPPRSDQLAPTPSRPSPPPPPLVHLKLPSEDFGSTQTRPAQRTSNTSSIEDERRIGECEEALVKCLAQDRILRSWALGAPVPTRKVALLLKSLSSSTLSSTAKCEKVARMRDVYRVLCSSDSLSPAALATPTTTWTDSHDLERLTAFALKEGSNTNWLGMWHDCIQLGLEKSAITAAFTTSSVHRSPSPQANLALPPLTSNGSSTSSSPEVRTPPFAAWIGGSFAQPASASNKGDGVLSATQAKRSTTSPLSLPSFSSLMQHEPPDISLLFPATSRPTGSAPRVQSLSPTNACFSPPPPPFSMRQSPASQLKKRKLDSLSIDTTSPSLLVGSPFGLQQQVSFSRPAQTAQVHETLASQAQEIQALKAHVQRLSEQNVQQARMLGWQDALLQSHNVSAYNHAQMLNQTLRQLEALRAFVEEQK